MSINETSHAPLTLCIKSGGESDALKIQLLDYGHILFFQPPFTVSSGVIEFESSVVFGMEWNCATEACRAFFDILQIRENTQRVQAFQSVGDKDCTLFFACMRGLVYFQCWNDLRALLRGEEYHRVLMSLRNDDVGLARAIPLCLQLATYFHSDDFLNLRPIMPEVSRKIFELPDDVFQTIDPRILQVCFPYMRREYGIMRNAWMEEEEKHKRTKSEFAQLNKQHAESQKLITHLEMRTNHLHQAVQEAHATQKTLQARVSELEAILRAL
jgi:hypothetical protein